MLHMNEPVLDELISAGAFFHQRGWTPATSGNFSSVLTRTPLTLALTASGRDKGRLAQPDFLKVGDRGEILDPGGNHANKPSAEIDLHLAIAKYGNAGAVLHTHSIFGTLLSDRHFAEGGFEIEGYEILKGLTGIDTHDTRIRVEIFENTQNIARMARQVERRLQDPLSPLRHGFLIHRHGLYAWGRDVNEARRHIETFEFLFELMGREK